MYNLATRYALISLAFVISSVHPSLSQPKQETIAFLSGFADSFIDLCGEYYDYASDDMEEYGKVMLDIQRQYYESGYQTVHDVMKDHGVANLDNVTLKNCQHTLAAVPEFMKDAFVWR